MTLRQKIAELIGRFDGLDAAERPWKRDQLVSDLLALLQNEQATMRMPQPEKTADLPAKKAG
ncbi:MAG: hypothetical protein ACM359_14815 [Bacillota bacterium]